LGNGADDIDKQGRFMRTLQAYRTEGILLAPVTGPLPATVDRAPEGHPPCVVVNRYLPDRDCATTDNPKIAQIGSRHLLDHGHERIAFIGGPADSGEWQDCVRGYRAALAQRDLAVDERLIVATTLTHRGGQRAILDLMSLADPPTAALCFTDVIAFGVMLGLQAIGRLAGRDFAVVGCDDISEAEIWYPPLTTVAVKPSRIGYEAANLLFERIAHPDGPPRQVLLEPTLVIRESCGPHGQARLRLGGGRPRRKRSAHVEIP
jgi:LacI family transcriptional regulator